MSEINESLCYVDCKYLEPKEKDQEKGVPHKCIKHNKFLYHFGYHPQLPKLQQCNYTLSEYTKEQHGIKKPQTHDSM